MFQRVAWTLALAGTLIFMIPIWSFLSRGETAVGVAGVVVFGIVASLVLIWAFGKKLSTGVNVAVALYGVVAICVTVALLLGGKSRPELRDEANTCAVRFAEAVAQKRYDAAWEQTGEPLRSALSKTHFEQTIAPWAPHVNPSHESEPTTLGRRKAGPNRGEYAYLRHFTGDSGALAVFCVNGKVSSAVMKPRFPPRYRRDKPYEVSIPDGEFLNGKRTEPLPGPVLWGKVTPPE